MHSSKQYPIINAVRTISVTETINHSIKTADSWRHHLNK